MYFQDFIGDKAELLEHAMAHPGLHPKRKPTLELAMKVVMSEVEMKVMGGITNAVLPSLQNAYDMYTLMNGEWGDVDVAAQSDWETGLDDQVENSLEPYEPHLSADWLARNTIDTRLWEDKAVEKLAQSVGKEVFKQMSYGKSPAQVLSNAGIVQTDVEVFFESFQANPVPVKQENAMTITAEDIAAKIRKQVGTDFDVMAVYEDIEGMMDDDEILAGASASRIGLGPEDVRAFQTLSLEMGDEATQHVFDMVKDAPAETAKAEKPKRQSKAKKEDAPAGDAPGAKATDAEGVVSAEILALLKDHGASKDTDMAAGLGVSRQTYGNWIAGKTPFTPTDEQRTFIRDELVKHVNGLLKALGALDGEEPELVF